ncbi:MAG: DUF1284 domain-containing protein [Nitrospiria bacterium]
MSILDYSTIDSFDKGEYPDYNFAMDNKSPRRFTIRGHTLLCLQGFQGEGYSPEFVAHLSSIHRSLSVSPDSLLEIVRRPDQICGVCPNLRQDGCHLNGVGSEAQMAAQDREVMARLEITDGAWLTWREVLRKVSKRITGDNLTEICGGCRWLPLGYCRDAIDQLRKGGLNEKSAGPAGAGVRGD